MSKQRQEVFRQSKFIHYGEIDVEVYLFMSRGPTSWGLENFVHIRRQTSMRGHQRYVPWDRRVDEMIERLHVRHVYFSKRARRND
jgi:hypothetical protein